MSAKTIVMVLVALVAAPALAVAQSEWVDDPVYPVIPPPDPGGWDGQRYPAAVLEVDGTYLMYFIGRLVGSVDQDFQIGHATSPDGLVWEIDPANPVLAWGAPGEWDDFGVGGGGVIHDGSLFRYWYGGADGEVTRVGYATSSDGSDWTKYGGNPIIDVGPLGSFDDTALIPGTVLFHDGLYRMWYFAARTIGPDPDDLDWRVGYAESFDGLSWNKHPDPVLGPRPGDVPFLVINLYVVFDGIGYHMWYTTDEDTAPLLGIAYAVSPDGIEWIRYPWNPVVGGNSGQPAVLRDQDSGEYTMWYADHPGLSFRRATSECCPGVFYDGFESGDTAGWTVTVP